ncbi:pentapeptide repeat-containing protein, partial [Methanospirillum sp.]|uniref:pentapeptide repeat-containing protein n=1 Tax=Methanospirillum sp. TaxID=45200 RepID=UPI001BD5DBF1
MSSLMADEKQVEAIKGGVASWNQWKEENPRKRPDLRGAHLTGLSLEGINLNGARLSETDFEFCNLKKA